MKYYKEGHRTLEFVDSDQIEAVESAGYSRTKPESKKVELKKVEPKKTEPEKVVPEKIVASKVEKSAPVPKIKKIRKKS